MAETTTAAAMAATNVTMSYRTRRGDTVVALDDVSLDVRRGEFLSLIGPSGCGKSTLLYILGGLRKQTSGEVTLEGERVTGPTPRKVGFVFQDYTLFPWRTIISNVEVGLEFRGTGKRERRERAERNLDLVGLGAFANAYPSELSGGMQQRVAIARALSLDPDILLMDEPFGALDEQTRTVLGEELARILEKTGKTIVFVTHSLSEAAYLSDRVVVMSARPGRIKEILPVDEPRPRGDGFSTSAAFNDLRNGLFDLLHEEVRAATLAEMNPGQASGKGGGRRG
ncbi:ABC transporter ATP-binding protein [Actinomadura syzygii]|uniref:ABC transporter ATP-binding protein n=1 Tax=Actinomadura syzygii TaxID=1427538 RepID=A0A5D0U6B0_9ACTN|nr:ABC transporter ATP-binding protein [Actinomadura syzygii]TYC13206.1 ABC transporter ATP-binding protein [Actinomadura syzygii]